MEKKLVAPHSTAIDDVFAALSTNADGLNSANGLSSAAVESRRREFGENKLQEAPPVPRWQRFLNQFRELVIWILVVAALVSGFAGEWPDALAILAIILVNALIGFFQEERAERAIEALQQMSAPEARVLRDGETKQIPASELVPGDVVSLEAGDNIPADVRLLETSRFSVQEAALTGESVSVEKNADATLPSDTSIGDRCNMAFMGTVAATGKAAAVVTHTGMQTELGHIAGLLQRSKPSPTPLQRRLSELGKILVVVVLFIVVVIFAMQVRRGDDVMETLLASISLAVAAVPEGLPAVVTIALALGLQRMVRRNALIRKLASVETLGSVTVICSDKTGTLTRNEMTVREVHAGGKRYRVTGAGYAPKGNFEELTDDRQGARHQSPEPPPMTSAAPLTDFPPSLARCLTAAARCNSAKVVPDKSAGGWKVIGDPTEGALVVAALKADIPANGNESTLFEIPFDSDRKMMSVAMATTKTGAPTNPSDTRETIMYSKGAPEVILDKCTTEFRDGTNVELSDRRRTEITDAASDMAARALRVLAVAYRSEISTQDVAANERELTFAGLIGMIDPPREEAKAAVEKCQSAGIRPVMITGDHPETALAIARELRIHNRDGERKNGAPKNSEQKNGESRKEGSSYDDVATGKTLDRLSDDELVAAVPNISVYARVSAEHKLRVVDAWKRRGDVVAMTGDGVNDAPAIKAADIGIAMGITGTHVSKEASDMVLIDDNFSSIINAVEEGRGIFDNIHKFIHYLLSCNAGEVIVMFVAALLGWPVPLTAIQILWINLVTDGLPALALGVELPEKDVMRRRPRPPRESVITTSRGALILFHGGLIAAASLVAYWWTYQGDESNLPVARTVTFCVMAFSQLFFAIGCRSQRFTMPQLGFFSNPLLILAVLVSGLLQLSVVTIPYAQPFFEVVTDVREHWGLMLVLSLAPVTIVELAKLGWASAIYVVERTRTTNVKADNPGE